LSALGQRLAQVFSALVYHEGGLPALIEPIAANTVWKRTVRSIWERAQPHWLAVAPARSQLDTNAGANVDGYVDAYPPDGAGVVRDVCVLGDVCVVGDVGVVVVGAATGTVTGTVVVCVTVFEDPPHPAGRTASSRATGMTAASGRGIGGAA
jgi:hypothetical protein